MSIKKYNQKRDFKQTSEPKGKKEKSHKKLIFVIQKHDASRLHFDFRLELDGVLKSWAVPKGLSTDPSVKRLAMHVEDHPFSYKDFEGLIPEGNYGAGTVMVWDNGTYHSLLSSDPNESEKILKQQYKDGDLKLILNGKKIKGEYHLFRMNKERDQWLIKKGKDEYANTKIESEELSVKSGKTLEEIAKGNKFKKEELKLSKNKSVSNKKQVEESKGNEIKSVYNSNPFDPKENISPMLATLSDQPFNSKDYIFEIKLDGYRAIASLDNKGKRFYSRNGIDFSQKFSDIYDQLDSAFIDTVKSIVVDGEIIALDTNGSSSFQRLQNYLRDKNNKSKGKDKDTRSNSKASLVYYVFDILFLNGKDLRGLELTDRKELLKKVIKKSSKSNIKLLKHIANNGEDLYDAACEQGFEGIIAKKKDSYYQSGIRSLDWLKIKSHKQQEAIIAGYTNPKGSRYFTGGLVLAVNEKTKLKYIGNVGTGFTEEELKRLEKLFKPVTVNTPTLDDYTGNESEVNWLKPQYICEVKYSEWTEDGYLRHPVYLGLREDKKVHDIKKEEPVKAKKIKQLKLPSEVQLTNLNKIYWPEDKYTKGDLIDYYRSISKYILPYLKDRPESLRRNPDGIKDKGFFQKDVQGKVPEWIETIEIFSESTGELIDFMVCNNEETLLYMANLGCIELNPWSSRIGTIDMPDYAVFDLDPLAVDFKAVVKVALEIKKILDEIKIKGFVKTSGSKGIHIYIPLGARYNYEQTQQFVHIIELIVKKRLPDLTSLERLPSERKGRVYLDYLQNGKGKTMASIYSARPKMGATVSTPLDWSEVNAKLNPGKFTIKTVPKRLEKEGDLWDGLLSSSINLKKVLTSLESLI